MHEAGTGGDEGEGFGEGERGGKPFIELEIEVFLKKLASVVIEFEGD